MLTTAELNETISKLEFGRVTEEYINSRIKRNQMINDGTTTIVIIELDNGFKTVGMSACVDERNYNVDIGYTLAYKDAFNKLWPLFGFLLAEKKYVEKTLAEEDE